MTTTKNQLDIAVTEITTTGTTHYVAKAVGYSVIDVISEMPTSSHIFENLEDATDYAMTIGRNSNQPARYDVMTLWIHEHSEAKTE